MNMIIYDIENEWKRSLHGSDTIVRMNEGALEISDQHVPEPELGSDKIWRQC